MSEQNESYLSKDRIVPVDLEQEMKKSFISYAMAVIVSRALPDVRDGLKPVHRRILYSMDELGLRPDKPYRKSARIVGDTMGKYHPHGDSSIYEAMVRMAQDFSTRYTLVDGHGNFGSVDGDGAAAMRYTEARLSPMAVEMLQDLDKDTVDFGPNFDETLKQPLVLPSRIPNLLVNGSGGIAVGMATNIPPHNLVETINGYIALIDNPDITTEELMEYIPGPDFPTGGIIQGRAGISAAYRTGRGRILVRGRAEIEQYAPNHARIIITEIPYQVNKAKLVERIGELVREKRIEGISALRDETDRNGMRVVVECKRDVNASVILNQLYKHTDLQTTFGVIMLALVDGEPRVLSLRQILVHYLEHQKDVVTRRTRHDLERTRERLHILEGLLRALDLIDQIVALIRSSPNANAAREGLMAQFGFSEKQAQAILDMRLQRLTGLEREKLQAEFDELTGLAAYLAEILADEGKLLGVLKEEAIAIRDRHGDERRTEIAQLAEDIDLDDIIQEEPMAVTMTHLGYVKRVTPNTYRAQNRGGRGIMGQATREEDFVERIFVASTHDQIMYFTNRGRAFRTKCYVIPEAGRTSRGTAIVNLLPLQGDERVTAVFPIPHGETDGVAKEDQKGYLVMATKFGLIKKTPVSEFSNIRKGGLIALNLREGDELIAVEYSTGGDEFVMASRTGRGIRFAETDVRAMGRTAAGVRSMLLEDGDEVVGLAKVLPDHYVLTVTENGMGKRTPVDAFREQRRGGKGVTAMVVNDRSGLLCGLNVVGDDDDLMLIRDDGTVIRMPVSQVSINVSRATQGVRLMRVEEGTRVVAVEILPSVEEIPETPEQNESDALNAVLSGISDETGGGEEL